MPAVVRKRPATAFSATLVPSHWKNAWPSGPLSSHARSSWMTSSVAEVVS